MEDGWRKPYLALNEEKYDYRKPSSTEPHALVDFGNYCYRRFYYVWPSPFCSTKTSMHLQTTGTSRSCELRVVGVLLERSSAARFVNIRIEILLLMKAYLLLGFPPTARRKVHDEFKMDLQKRQPLLDTVWVKTVCHIIVIGQDFLSIEAVE
jgi:hypothetical protein